MCCAASARAGLDTGQLLSAVPALARDSGDHHDHPRGRRLAHAGVLTWKEPLTPTDAVWWGCGSWGHHGGRQRPAIPLL